MREKSFTFIDVLVGTSIVLIVFFGIFGAYQLGMQVVGQSKNKITANAISNKQIEEIRNLSYESVGVKGGFPDGVLESATTTILNNIEYTIETRVDFVVDPADGIASPEDECPNDYKKAEVKVSWGGKFPGEIKLVDDISPKNLAQECATGGGILSVSVFDAYGNMVSSPLIEVKNPSTGQTIKIATPIEGKHYFSLATSTYKVIVSKSDYSLERTYGTYEIAIPEKPHPIVLESQMTEISFSIDKVSSFSVDSLSLWGEDFWSDSFQDTSKILEIENVVINYGEAKLATTSEGYLPSGFLISTEILPTNLLNWNSFVFRDSEPLDTNLKYQIYYATNTSWLLIPDTDLPGNSAGFNESPVDLSGFDPAVYSQLKLRANFSTNTTTTTPVLYDWQVSWITSAATPIPNTTFNLRGAKLIGYDSGENPVYKYSQNHTSNSQGKVDILNLEWDNYTFSVSTTSDLNLVGTDPEPQPIGLAPDTTLTVNLYLKSENSLLVTVQNNETLGPIFSAQVRLYNLNLGYDNILYTNEKGQVFFMPLEAANYNLEIEAPGCSDYAGTVGVLGNATEIVGLERVE